jgi:hypothetical protein
MTISATEIMRQALTEAVVDAVLALKAASNGLPNALLRDLNAIYPNTAAADLPPALRDAIANSVRLTFTRLKKDGYVVVDAKEVLEAKRVEGSGSPLRPSNAKTPRPTPRGTRSSR